MSARYTEAAVQVSCLLWQVSWFKLKERDWKIRSTKAVNVLSTFTSQLMI